MLTLEEFMQMPKGQIFRVVITKYHDNTEFGNPELIFVCVKGDSDAGDWSIYYAFADQGAAYAASSGMKLKTQSKIQYILPCELSVLEKYRL